MASLQSMSNWGSHGTKYKDSKSKTKSAVKPILKKWSQSEKVKRSFDSERRQGEHDGSYQSTETWGRSSSLSFYGQAMGGADAATTKSGRQASGIVAVGLGMLGGSGKGRRHDHSRSISGTSYASGTTSNSSNGAPTPRQTGATFVHPFQQTPRTSTPPLLLSYANSLASVADTRDYSPTTITEDEDDDIGTGIEPSTNQLHYNIASHHPNNVSASLTNFHHSHPNHTTSNSHSQPALVSQRTPSIDISDTISSKIPSHPPLRVNTLRTSSSIALHPRLANVPGGSDLYLEHIADSPTSSNLQPTIITSPTSSINPMSPLRTSLDGAFPRLRAKTDLDTVTRAEHLRAARRKFEIKERAKEEKYAREQIKRRERADNKRAQELEKQIAQQHKEQLAAMAQQEAAELEEAIQRAKHNRKISGTSSARPSLSMPRPSLTLGRPSMSRKNTSNLNSTSESEKFMSSNYNNMEPSSPPAYGRNAGTANSVQFTSSPKRKSAARKKTHSAWTAFILWLRTRLLRLSKSKK